MSLIGWIRTSRRSNSTSAPPPKADILVAVTEALEAKPDLSLAYLAKTLPTKEPDGLDPYLDGLRKAGLPE